MTGAGRQAMAALAVAGTLVMAGCGSSEEPEGDPLPSATVRQLEQRLDEVERRYQDAVDNGNVGACSDIGADSLPAIRNLIGGLPDRVDAELRTAVERSFERLGELAEKECADVEPAPEPEPVPEPEPIPEETIPEETVPQETAPVEPPPEELPEEIVPPQNNGKGNGKGKGNDGGIQGPPGLEGEG